MTTRKKLKRDNPTCLGNQDRPYGKDGVDVTLIRWMLRLTPEERLKTLENNVAALNELRRGIRPA